MAEYRIYKDNILVKTVKNKSDVMRYVGRERDVSRNYNAKYQSFLNGELCQDYRTKAEIEMAQRIKQASLENCQACGIESHKFSWALLDLENQNYILKVCPECGTVKAIKKTGGRR